MVQRYFFLTTAALLFLLTSVSASAQIWQWAIAGGGMNADAPVSIATDTTGTTYMVGTFSGNAFFGGAAISGIGPSTMVVARVSPIGVVEWSVPAGGSGEMQPAGIGIDRAGNIYVAGSFTRTITLGSTVLATAGGRDIFVARLSPSGNFQWARRGGGFDDDVATGIAVDNHDNILVAGWFNGSPTFDTIDFSTNGGADILLLKYLINGDLVAAISDGGGGDERPADIGLDGNGNVVLAGRLDGIGSLAGRRLEATNGDIFVAGYARTFVPLWAISFGSDSADAATAVAVDRSGNIAVTGFFADSMRADTTLLVSHALRDIFLIRLDANGGIRWGISGGGDGDDQGDDVVFMEGRGIEAIATVTDTARFNATEIPIASPAAMLGMSFEHNGMLRSVHSATGSQGVMGVSIATGRGGIYYSGTLRGSAGFGSITLSSRGATDIFIGRYGPDASVTIGPVDNGPYCPGARLRVPYDISGAFSAGNVFSVELSNKDGSFANPIVIGVHPGGTPGSIDVQIPEGAEAGIAYRLRVVSSAPRRISDPTTTTISIAGVPRPVIEPQGTVSLCPGEIAVLDAGDGYVSYAWSNGATTRRITVSASGVYSVQVTTPIGCSGASGDVEVVLQPATPKPVATQLTHNLLESTPADFYQWLRDGQDIPGATSRRYLADRSGNYSVRVALQNLCTALSDAVTLEISSVDGPINQSGLAIRPNPAREYVWIELPKMYAGFVTVTLRDAMGRAVMRHHVDAVMPGVHLLLDLSALVPGFYVAEIDYRQQRTIRTFIRE